MNRYVAFGIFVVFLATTLAVAQNVEVATTIAFTEGPTVDADGNVYFTDQTNNRIMKLGADRKLSTFRHPSSYAIFYLVEANPGEKGARLIRAYDLGVDGTVTNMRVFHNFYPGRSGDGMSIDVKGNLYVAAGLHRRRGTSETLDTKPGIHVFAPSGELLKFIPHP